MNRLPSWIALLGLVACSKTETSSPGAAPASEPAAKPVVAPVVAPAPAQPKPQIKDDGAKQLLAAGSKCPLQEGALPLDCPERKAIEDYAFQHQSSEDAAETCAAFLQDPDTAKRLLAANCLGRFNAMTVTSQLGAALDAIEAEHDDKVREEIAWGVRAAEALTAKLDDRVLALVTKLEANPNTEVTAGHLFTTLFPQYLMAGAPKPPPKAQALAIEALAKDGSELQRVAMNAVKLLDDKPAVCAALKAPHPKVLDWQREDMAKAVKQLCPAK